MPTAYQEPASPRRPASARELNRVQLPSVRDTLEPAPLAIPWPGGVGRGTTPMIGGLPQHRGPDVPSAAGSPRQFFGGGSGWLAPVDGNSGPGLRFKALAKRSDPCDRCHRLASRASRSSSSQCQGPSRMRRRIRTGPWTAQTAVRFTGSSCSSTCVVLAMVESSPQRSTLRQGLCCCLGQASMAVRRLFGRRCCGPAGGSRPGGWTERWVSDRVAGSRRIRPMMAATNPAAGSGWSWVEREPCGLST